MLFFLKLVGASLLALIILVLCVYLFVKYKIRKFFKDLADGISGMDAGTVPPFRIKLVTRERAEERARQYADEEDEDDEFFMNEEEVQARADTLGVMGFRLLGDFNTDAMLNMRVLVHDEKATYAVVYDHYGAGVWCDVYRSYQDGSSWTFSTTKDPGMDIMPRKQQRFHPDAELAEVVNQFWREAPSESVEVVSDDQFSRYFEKKYAEEMNWNIQRGGPTESEIRRIADNSGEECTPEVVKSIQDQWAVAIGAFLSDLAIKQFNKENDVSKQQVAEREDRVIAVHDRVPTEQLFESVYEDFYMDEEGDDEDADPEMEPWRKQFQEIKSLHQSGGAVQAFNSILDGSGKREKFEHLGTVSKPVAAEIWLRPYFEDFDEEDEDWDDRDEELDDFEL